MKPIDAVALPIASDLSGASLNEAYGMIEVRLGGYFFLRCASQLAPTALLLLNQWGMTVELDFAYAPDEWSIHQSVWVDGKHETSSVWSPGA